MSSLLWFVILGSAVRAILCSELRNGTFSNETFSDVTHRQSREFPFYSVGRIANVYCMGTNGLSGTCQIRGECAANGGIASGSCNSLTFQAVCCVYVSSCGGSSSNNITYFQNSGYPAAYNGGGSCIYTVVPPDATICQLRIDFSSFTLSQPDDGGNCVVDSLTITGASSPVQVICGDNNGQHIYVSFNGLTNIILTVATTGATSFNRVWNIQLSLISCTSPYLAPRGCLQYHQDISGEVLSLNYGPASNPASNALGLIGTRQLANSNYGICIRVAPGQCSITFNLPSSDPFAFTMTGDAAVITTTMVGTPVVGLQGTQCTTDYLVIPNPVGIANDRFCGLGLPAGITMVPPDTTICQLRIDFSSFTLSQPDSTGRCAVDSLTISGAGAAVQVICGDNNGQHIYVPFSGTNNVIITVATTAATSFNRVWNLQLSLISCTSPYLAPRGCLQYHQDSSGEVLSLNYGPAASPATNAMGLIGTRQLANTNYGICIRVAPGQCSITFNLPSSDPFAFTLTGDATVITTNMLGTPVVGMQGTACTTDYLIIPNPVGIANDRFCGLGLPASITSNTRPFVLHYITDAADGADVANRGFRLQYSQNACPIPAAG